MATDKRESNQKQNRTASFSKRLGRNVGLFGVPWLIIGLIFSWPKTLHETALALVYQLPGTLLATLLFSLFEHWYVMAKSQKTGGSEQ